MVDYRKRLKTRISARFSNSFPAQNCNAKPECQRSTGSGAGHCSKPHRSARSAGYLSPLPTCAGGGQRGELIGELTIGVWGHWSRLAFTETLQTVGRLRSVEFASGDRRAAGLSALAWRRRKSVHRPNSEVTSRHALFEASARAAVFVQCARLEAAERPIGCAPAGYKSPMASSILCFTNCLRSASVLV